MTSERVTTVGTTVEYVPPAEWKDKKAGNRGVVTSQPAMDNEGNWSVVVRFNGEDRWHAVGIHYLEIIS